MRILCRDPVRTTKGSLDAYLTYRPLSVFVRAVQSLIKPFSDVFSRPAPCLLTQFVTVLFGKHDLSPCTRLGFQARGVPLERVLSVRLRSGQRGSGILQKLALEHSQTQMSYHTMCQHPLT